MNTKKMTLASAFETVAKELEGSGLTEQAYAKVSAETAYIKNKLRVNISQAFILSVMLQNTERTLGMKDFAEFASVSPIRIMALQKDFDQLEDREFIMSIKTMTYSTCEQSFIVNSGTIEAVKYNKKYEVVRRKELSAFVVFDLIERLLNDCDYSRLSYLQMLDHLDRLIADCQHIDFCKKVKQLEMSHPDLVLFLIAVVKVVIRGDNKITSIDYEDILPNIYRRQMEQQFKASRHFLYLNNLMEPTDEDCDSFRLTKKAMEEYLTEFGFIVEDVESDDEADTLEEDEDDAIESSETVKEVQSNDSLKGSPVEVLKESIVEKELFYNPEEAEQVERLKDLLSPDKFVKVMSRMRAAGMRLGFACLLYGSPGTGKTETVKQIARATGREIIQVNMANIRNLYVGESEKNIQKVFDEYKERMRNFEEPPILLFNEADGIFGTRCVGVDNVVSQMENTIQNIILQNMETFEGILIATTNLTDNFDKAFERRFLYKIYFEKPNKDVRKQIWKSVLPQLTPEDAATLASRYQFTGSMIENVARRLTIDEVLYGRTMTLDTLIQLCDEELIKNPIGIKKRGA